jgi:hypothetical protein
MGAFEIETYLSHLAVRRRLTPSSQNQALTGQNLECRFWGAMYWYALKRDAGPDRTGS